MLVLIFLQSKNLESENCFSLLKVNSGCLFITAHPSEGSVTEMVCVKVSLEAELYAYLCTFSLSCLFDPPCGGLLLL